VEVTLITLSLLRPSRIISRYFLGTYFFDKEEVWKPPLGAALAFSGQLLHGGDKSKPKNDSVMYSSLQVLRLLAEADIFWPDLLTRSILYRMKRL
jgi:hypothetical protein